MISHLFERKMDGKFSIFGMIIAEERERERCADGIN